MAAIRKMIERIVPIYAVLPLVTCFAFNCLIYYGNRLFTSELYHYDMTLKVDELTPLVPWTVSIYFGCYIFWVINYILIGRISREHCYRFCVADMCSRVICGLFFVLLPTTNARPELEIGGLWNDMMHYLYQIDAADNLFPSIHCLVSWFCFIGIRGQKKIPVWYQVLSCMIALSVFVSTLTTKQHVLVDVIGGIVLAELMYYISHRNNWWKYYAKCADAVSGAVFRCNIIGDHSEE